MVRGISYDPNETPPSESGSEDDLSDTASDTKGMPLHEEAYPVIAPAMSSSDSDSDLAPDNLDRVASTKSAKDSPADQRRTPSTPNRSSFRHSVQLSINEGGLPHPNLWSNNQVVEWLNQVGFESVSGLFRDNEITGDILIKLDLNSLKDIGVLAFGKRFNLNNAISALKNKYGLQSPTKKDGECSSDDDPPPPATEVRPCMAQLIVRPSRRLTTSSIRSTRARAASSPRRCRR